jgi:hypothetical protein
MAVSELVSTPPSIEVIFRETVGETP